MAGWKPESESKRRVLPQEMRGKGVRKGGWMSNECEECLRAVGVTESDGVGPSTESKLGDVQ